MDYLPRLGTMLFFIVFFHSLAFQGGETTPIKALNRLDFVLFRLCWLAFGTVFLAVMEGLLDRANILLV